MEGELIADSESCTRYHVCRLMEESENEFTSDIAICPQDRIFDMITSTCKSKKCINKSYIPFLF